MQSIYSLLTPFSSLLFSHARLLIAGWARKRNSCCFLCHLYFIWGKFHFKASTIYRKFRLRRQKGQNCRAIYIYCRRYSRYPLPLCSIRYSSVVLVYSASFIKYSLYLLHCEQEDSTRLDSTCFGHIWKSHKQIAGCADRSHPDWEGPSKIRRFLGFALSNCLGAACFFCLGWAKRQTGSEQRSFFTLYV